VDVPSWIVVVIFLVALFLLFSILKAPRSGRREEPRAQTRVDLSSVPRQNGSANKQPQTSQTGYPRGWNQTKTDSLRGATVGSCKRAGGGPFNFTRSR